jgi:uncharacterized protein (DUF983 family)
MRTSGDPHAHRALWPALLRGLRGRCPNCGRGRIFRAFLKVADRCSACGEAFHHHRADDAPAYFVILIIAHMVVPVALTIELTYRPPYWIQLAFWLPATLVLALLLLQPVKGAIVALQWAYRMHGFDPDAEADAASEPKSHRR